MKNNKSASKKVDYSLELKSYVDNTFRKIHNDSQVLLQSLSSKDFKTKNLAAIQAQNLFKFESKISSLLELYELEQNRFSNTRKFVNICDQISTVVNNLKKKNPQIKTIVEIHYPSDKPEVRLKPDLFQKWFFNCLDKLYSNKAVSRIKIEVFNKKNGTVIKISQKGLSGENDKNTKGIDWIFAKLYFELENGDLTHEQDGGLKLLFTSASPDEEVVSKADDVTDVEILKKLKDGDDLPTLSPIAVKIVKLASDASSSAQDIANVITLDPAMTAKLLKVVNSPFYGFAKEITSISQAVALLGMKAVRTLALCISIIDTFPSESDRKFDYRSFWERSFASAVACRITAKKLCLHIEEEAFITGLTQNIGSLIFARFYPTKYTRILEKHKKSGDALIAAEQNSWGIDHAKLGSELFSLWKMPAILGHTILYHHSPSKVPENNHDLKNLATLVYLSELSSRVLFDGKKSVTLQQLKTEYKSLLKIDEIEVDEIMQMVSNEIEIVAGEFNFTIKTPIDYAQILQNANIELAKINLDYEQINRALEKEKKRADELTLKLRKANKLLEKEVNTDGLTKLYNHRFFFELVTKEFANFQRNNFPLSCIMIDIDFFKNVNDTYGHQVGDKVLEGVGKILKEVIRTGDFAARYGGEEFVIILPNTVVDKAKMVAERIRKSAENKNLIDNFENKKITLSAGVASTENNNVSNAIELVGLADKAVYKAKNEGRNRVVVYSHDKSKI